MTGAGSAEAFDLSGKIALVTGAAKGFGRFFSQVLAEAGAGVVCSDVDADSLIETVRLVEEAGGRAIPSVADVSSPEAVRNMVDEAVSAFGRLDVAVNNAGIATKPSRFHEIEFEDWHRLIAIDLTGVFLCMREELRVMVERGGGAIVNIASVAGIVGVEPELMPRANYVAAKHGVVGLTKQAALEYAQDGIRVNAIAPGWFSGTGLGKERRAIQSQGDGAVLKQRRDDSIPMRRTGNVSELRGLLLYLASDASSYVTGQVHVVDGGVSAR